MNVRWGKRYLCHTILSSFKTNFRWQCCSVHLLAVSYKVCVPVHFLCPSLANFPPSHLLGCTSLITLHEWPLLAEPCIGLNWNVLSPLSALFPLTNLFGAAFLLRLPAGVSMNSIRGHSISDSCPYTLDSVSHVFHAPHVILSCATLVCLLCSKWFLGCMCHVLIGSLVACVLFSLVGFVMCSPCLV